MSIKTILAETTLTVRDFIELTEDDLIQLDQKTKTPLKVLVAGKPKFVALPGKSGRKRAIKIVRQVSPMEEMIYE